ncbi:MAG: helix-turn-helix domain-containing protein [Spirochaetaceae bacterium]|nr:helix-turn-helix domain-containing protein [Spirochaetaceae bacterium]
MNEGDIRKLSINQRIKLVREALKLNQRDFATRLSASHGLIAGIETGKPVNIRLIKLIASEFSVNEAWLSTGEGEMFTTNDDPQFARLLNAYKDLPPKYKTLIEKMIDILGQD